jgi:hypothetical protein
MLLAAVSPYIILIALFPMDDDTANIAYVGMFTTPSVYSFTFSIREGNAHKKSVLLVFR